RGAGRGDLREEVGGGGPSLRGHPHPGLAGRVAVRSRSPWRPSAGLLPWSLCFAVFGLLPLFTAFLLSFFDMNPLRPDRTHWVGLANYTRALGSPSVWSEALRHESLARR